MARFEMPIDPLGPRCEATISFTEAIANELGHTDRPLPAPITGQVLFDTGAQSSAILERIAREMVLPVAGTATVNSATRKNYSVNLYTVSLVITGFSIAIKLPEARALPYLGQEAIAVIGRDILDHGVFTYDGKSGRFSFEVES